MRHRVTKECIRLQTFREQLRRGVEDFDAADYERESDSECEDDFDKYHVVPRNDPSRNGENLEFAASLPADTTYEYWLGLMIELTLPEEAGGPDQGFWSTCVFITCPGLTQQAVEETFTGPNISTDAMYRLTTREYGGPLSSAFGDQVARRMKQSRGEVLDVIRQSRQKVQNIYTDFGHVLEKVVTEAKESPLPVVQVEEVKERNVRPRVEDDEDELMGPDDPLASDTLARSVIVQESLRRAASRPKIGPPGGFPAPGIGHPDNRAVPLGPGSSSEREVWSGMTTTSSGGWTYSDQSVWRSSWYEQPSSSSSSWQGWRDYSSWRS